MVKRNRPWKLIDGKMYHYKGYRSDRGRAYSYKLSLLYGAAGNFGRTYEDVQILRNHRKNRTDIYVRPTIS